MVLALVMFGQLVLWPGEASAATINVSSTADVATNFGACGSPGQTVPTGTSLREAVCAANNAGAASTTITVAAGTYVLTNGELAMGKVAGSNITLTGAGSGSTIIDGNHNSRVFDLDPSVLGGVTTSISGVTITNGRDGTFGGAGIIAGGGHNAKDHLTIANSVISNNQANFAAPTTSNKPGGGISFEGGDLSVTNVTFTGNQSFSSDGSAPVLHHVRGGRDADRHQLHLLRQLRCEVRRLRHLRRRAGVVGGYRRRHLHGHQQHLHRQHRHLQRLR